MEYSVLRFSLLVFWFLEKNNYAVFVFFRVFRFSLPPKDHPIRGWGVIRNQTHNLRLLEGGPLLQYKPTTYRWDF